VTLGPRDAAALAAILRQAARTEIMPRFRRLDAGGVRAKSGPQDLVTDADESAERRIAAALAKLFPDALVVGEEAAAADASLLDRLAEADRAIVLDPLDGTFNFAHGVPLFAVMAAVLVRGEAVLAAIHDPLGDDTALALRGEGAWVERADGTRADLRVRAAEPPERMGGIASWQFLPEPLKSRVLGRLPRLAATWSYRCAAHEYRLAASGGCHFLLYHRLLPWDHAPGWLLHQEAGGYSAHFDGAAYRPRQISGGLLCAPDRESWEALRATLLEG
jgi:fructose-1,6-bisphosphatase/inositol monophosphatase family enzyme